MCRVTPEGSFFFLHPSSSLSLFFDSVVAPLTIDSQGSRSVVDMHRVPQRSGGEGVDSVDHCLCAVFVPQGWGTRMFFCFFNLPFYKVLEFCLKR